MAFSVSIVWEPVFFIKPPYSIGFFAEILKPMFSVKKISGYV